MPTFGTSAFLRLVSSTPRVRRTIIRQRLTPSESAYDFHRIMRLRAGSFLRGTMSAEAALAACEEITSPAERNAAKNAILKLIDWRRGTPGPATDFAPATFESPNGVFKVAFRPDFAMTLEGQVTAIHLWNTKSPKLDVRLTQATLSLFPSAYGGAEGPGDLAVFSLRDMRFIRLREADFDHAALAANLIEHIETLFEEVAAEGTGASRPSPPPALPPV